MSSRGSDELSSPCWRVHPRYSARDFTCHETPDSHARIGFIGLRPSTLSENEKELRCHLKP